MLEAEVLEHVSGVNFHHRFIRKLAPGGSMPDKIDLRHGLHIEISSPDTAGGRQ